MSDLTSDGMASLVNRALNAAGGVRDQTAYAELVRIIDAQAGDVLTWAASVVDDPAGHGATPHEAKLVERLLKQARS
jgi:hypothetical protein